jgi:outer membrane protein assembly factor BamA
LKNICQTLKIQAIINRLLFTFFICLLVCVNAIAQYKVAYISVDKTSDYLTDTLKLTTSFTVKTAFVAYVEKLPDLLVTKGFAAASVDSVVYDTSSAVAYIYTGDVFKLAAIAASSENKKLLEQSGYNEKIYTNKLLNVNQLKAVQNKLLDYLENNGYPFATIKYDSIQFHEGKLHTSVVIDKGPLYHIDSIRINGNAKISNAYMQRYLGITNGAIYQKNKLQNITRLLLELPFLQEEQSWNLSMLGTGSIINMYLQPKKASQVNVLLGFLPANNQTVNNKLLLTGEANINLRNALGSGETIGLNWQQLQVKSPRLNILYQQPYLFGSAFGLSTSFNLLKKDSSYLNLDAIVGLQYALSTTQSGKIFFQHFRTNLLTVDTNQIRNTMKLPDNLDVSVSSFGVDYEINKTNYRLNPRKGNSAAITISAGTRNIRKNNVISDLKGGAFNYDNLYDTVKLKSYQFRLKTQLAKYFPIAKNATFKIAVSGGWVQSPSLYRNELFQLGGYKLLRGFDEESIFASQYAVSTFEYRYLLAVNSYFFVFTDAGWAANKSVYARISNNFIGAGVGLNFETKAGLINLSLAAGKKDDTKFNLRQSKIHLGFVSYF